MSLGKKKSVYWLTQSVSDIHRHKVELLHQRGYQVTFYATLDELVAASATRRSGILVIGDEGDETEVGRAIHLLSTLPLTGGARLILSISTQRNSVKNLAAATAFRDLLPLNLADNQWIRRFAFATAGRAVDMPIPHPQISMNSIAAVALPSRLVWVSPQKILIECRTSPKADDNLTLSGPLAEAMGVKSLSLVVEETRKHELMYRFSDAVVARWSVPEVAKARSQHLLEKIKHSSKGPKCKVYVVVQNTSLRAELFDHMLDDRIDVSTALQKNAIAEEPRFFSPDIVFIEDSFCAGEDAPRFLQMLEVLAKNVPVVVLGKKMNQLELQEIDSVRRFFVLPKLPPNLLSLVFTRYLPPALRRVPKVDEGAAYLSDSDPLSLGQISVPARIVQLHPSMITLSVPIPIGVFGLCRVDSPLIKSVIDRAPYAKITSSYEHPKAADPGFAHVIEGYLVDVDREDQRRIASHLSEMVCDSFGYSLPVTQTEARESEVSRERPANAGSKPADPLPVRQLITHDPLIHELEAAQAAEPQFRHELKIAAQASIEEIPRRPAAATKQWHEKAVWQWLIFLAVAGFLISAIYLGFDFLSENWQHSGASFSESVRQFRSR